MHQLHKLNCMYMIKHFQTDVEKRVVNFNCYTIRQTLIQKCNKNSIFCAFSFAIEHFGNKFLLINGNFGMRRL